MYRFITITAVFISALTGCVPKQYKGPLDSPVGNWKSGNSEYFFNSSSVAKDESCEYSAISFYKDSLCCIEGFKGAFKWTLDSDNLVVDSLIWSVVTLKGNEMTLKLIADMYHIDFSAEQEAPIEYMGMKISSDTDGYYYINGNDNRIECWPRYELTTEGTDSIRFWYDTRIDTYLPL